MPDARRRLVPLICAFACLCAAQSAQSQSFPSKPIRILTLFAAGSTGDTTARTFAPPFSDALGQPVVVENQPGAGGVLAAERVARSAPDGYTLLISLSSVHIMRIFLSRQTPFDPINDFTPITQLGEAVTMLVAHPSVPAGSLKELIDYAKANPGKVSYGTSGVGSPTHLTGELIAQLTGIQWVHVPYKAVSQAFLDTMAGQLPTSFAISSQALSAVRAGKVRALAIQENERFAALPDVPTIKEVVAGFEPPPSWPGLFGPAHLPPAVLRRLHAEAVKVLNSPDVKGKLALRDFTVSTQKSPEEFMAKIKREIELVGSIVKRAGIAPVD